MIFGDNHNSLINPDKQFERNPFFHSNMSTKRWSEAFVKFVKKVIIMRVRKEAMVLFLFVATGSLLLPGRRCGGPVLPSLPHNKCLATLSPHVARVTYYWCPDTCPAYALYHYGVVDMTAYDSLVQLSPWGCVNLCKVVYWREIYNIMKYVLSIRPPPLCEDQEFSSQHSAR